MNETFEYLQRRLEPQEKWHDERARRNKRLFYTVEVATLLAGAAIPVVNLWVVKDAYLARSALRHSRRSGGGGGRRRETVQVSRKLAALPGTGRSTGERESNSIWWARPTTPRPTRRTVSDFSLNGSRTFSPATPRSLLRLTETCRPVPPRRHDFFPPYLPLE